MKTNYATAIKRWRLKKTALGKQFRTARETKGISRGDVAKATGLSYQAIHKIETGQRLPQMGTVILIAQALGKTPEEMLK